jgi:uncharacterized membrane protein YoaK (UPF0700 family)
MQRVESFMSGMAMMGFIIAGLFFFRFWSRTRDRLFAIFGVAFLLMAVNEAFVDVSGSPTNEVVLAYVLRIIAFLMLIVGIVAKNLEERKSTKL